MRVTIDYESKSSQESLNIGDVVTREGENLHYMVATDWASNKVYFLCIETSRVGEIYDSIKLLNHDFLYNSHFANDKVTIFRKNEWQLKLSRV